VADDIPARPKESPIRAAPVTVPVSPAAVAEILTEDGEITLPAGSGADDVTVAAARHLVDLVNGRVQPAGTPSFNSAAGTLTVPVPGSTVTISARNVTSRGPRRRPSRLPRARSNPPAFRPQPSFPAARTRGFGESTPTSRSVCPRWGSCSLHPFAPTTLPDADP